MAKLTIAVFLLVVVAQTLLAQPVENVDSVADVFGAGDVVDTDEIGAPSDGGDDELPDEDLTDDEVDQAAEEVLSRVRRGLRSRLKHARNKYVKPVVESVKKFIRRCRLVCDLPRCFSKTHEDRRECRLVCGARPSCIH